MHLCRWSETRRRRKLPYANKLPYACFAVGQRPDGGAQVWRRLVYKW
jgi:hypothetical protein